MILQSVPQVLQILLFFALGFLLKRVYFLRLSDILVIKKIILSVSVPALLFTTFARISFTGNAVIPAVMTVLLYVLLMASGIGVTKLVNGGCRSCPLFFTTANFGLLGMTLYRSLFADGPVEQFAVFGIGHEFFMWFLLYTILGLYFGERANLRKVLRRFTRNPVSIGILLGCVIGAAGIYPALQATAVGGGVLLAIETMADINLPLMLIVLGFSVEIDRSSLKGAAALVAGRLAVSLIVGLAFKYLAFDLIFTSVPFDTKAYILLLILPPMFLLPILVDPYVTKDETVIMNNAVVLHSMVSIAIFVLFALFVG